MRATSWEPRRVLMTTDTLGGVWTYTLELARELAARGVEVTLASMGAPLRERQRDEAGSIAGLRVFESNHALEWMDDPWAGVDAAGEWLLELARHLAPDVVHLSGYAHGSLAWPTPVVVVAHSCVLSWWRAVVGERAPERYDEYRRRLAAGLASADAIVAPSRAMAEALLAEHDDELREEVGDRVRVIANGRGGERFSIDEPQPFVLAAGRRWDHGKNLALLERCASRLPWPTYIAGPSEVPRPGRAHESSPAVEGLSLADAALREPGAYALGLLEPDELNLWLARAAIYVAPARYEPFGLGPLEAGLSGCALVLGDIPSLREIWADAAIYVDPDDGEALERAIVRLCSSPELCATMAARARVRAAGYSAARMASQVLDLYRELLGCETAARSA